MLFIKPKLFNTFFQNLTSVLSVCVLVVDAGGDDVRGAGLWAVEVGL